MKEPTIIDSLAETIATAITEQCDMATDTTVVTPVQHVARVAAEAATAALPAIFNHGTVPGFAGRDDNGQSARADLLNTFATWLFTTRYGSREAADQILGKHRAEVLREAADRLVELRAAEREWLPATGLHKGEQEMRRMTDETSATGTAHGCPPDCPCRTVCVGPLKPAAGARQDGAQR